MRISYSIDVSSAVMQLRFDDSIAEYREVSAARKSSTVRAVCSDGCVKISLADSGDVNGRLFDTMYSQLSRRKL